MANNDTGGNRMIKKIIFIFFIFMWFCSSTSVFSAPDESEQDRQNKNNQQEGFAFSLRESQRFLKECIPDNCPEKLLQIDGMTRIVGFIVDSDNTDIILIGKKQDNAPPLYLENFVLALRKAWDLILFEDENGMIHRNVIDKTPIGCSIDPKKETDKKWSEFNEKYNSDGLQTIASSEEARKVQAEFQEMANDWVEICQEYQDVRVDGLYHNTMFSQIMVEADYYMKRLVDGSVKLDIDGFKSLTELKAEEGSSSSKISMNRFWFKPGENIFIETENEDAVFLKKSPVTLLTEEEFLNNAGIRKGKGKGDPLATEFAESFTDNYFIIKRIKPIYQELEGLCRFVAVTMLMEQRKAALPSGGILDYYLYQFPIYSTPVWGEVSGIPNVGPDIFNFFLTCGGVTTELTLKSDNNDHGKILTATRLSVLKDRPSQTSVSWSYRDFINESGILPTDSFLKKNTL